jgi:HD-GYP domain-containing protein (c-di-GMP phosphodiesterase class II)
MAESKAVQAVQNEQDADYISVPLSTLRVDSITNFDIYFRTRPHQPLVLYAEGNVHFNESVRQRLIDSHVRNVYIRRRDLRAYNRYLEGNLKHILGDPHLSRESKSEILYASASGVVESMVQRPPTFEAVQRTKDVVRHTVSYMLEDQKVFGCILKAVSSVYQIYTHSVNVVAYTVALAQYSGYTHPAMLRDVAMGAMLHDVGKSKIDPAVLINPNPLTEREWESMRRHPVYGHEMLLATGSVGEVALDIVLHHHENMNGDGYPDGLPAEEISPFARMVTIADCFDALTTERPFQRARNSFEALTLMKDQMSLDIDRALFKNFVALMGSVP